MPLVHTDCLHFRGSRPCEPHKQNGAVCEGCRFYERRGERVAIVKLGAMGDVVRTTALLRDVRAAHPSAQITWFTLEESLAYLGGIPALASVVALSDAAAYTGSQPFDVLYCLDNAAEGVALADTLPARQRRGFRSGSSGLCEGVWPPGDATLFEIGLRDDLKRGNTRSYLEMLAATAGLRYSGGAPLLHLPEAPASAARDAFANLPRPLVGLNTDAGTRWTRKQWNLPYAQSLVETLVERGFGVVLLGGPAVAEFNTGLERRFPSHVRAPQTAGDTHALAAAVSQLDLLVTGDTLAMHLAWAAGVPLVVLFGPTSHAEIDLGERDVKLFAEDLDCLGCYLRTCSVTPHCMDLIPPQRVLAAIDRRLAPAGACAR